MPPASPAAGPAARHAAAGALAGAAVGLLEGARAAVAAGLDLRPAFACLGLVVGVDLLAGALAGGAAGALTGLFAWGRAVRPAAPARLLGWLLAGALAAGTAAAAVAATAGRHNRFLAAGLVVLATLGAGLAGALVAPAVARLFAPRSAPRPPGERPSVAGMALVAPAVASLLGLAVFIVVVPSRAPVRGARLAQLQVFAAAVAALLPLALALASRAGSRLRPRLALATSAIGFGGGAALLIGLRWQQDFRFVRWHDLAALAGIGLGAAGLLRQGLGRRLSGRWLCAIGGGGAAVGLLVLLAAGASEPARKAAAAHTGLTAAALDGARPLLDLDRDGYTSLLGGGDCADRDAEINPGAQEWPGDGIDQNCDGKDAAEVRLESPPLHPVPDPVPDGLNLLLVTIDTLRADHLGAYGYPRPTSPAIDRLASEGALFESGWAHAPSTRYSMPAIATGRWPSAIAWQDCYDCDRGWPRLAPEQRTIGEALRRSGYTTGAYYAFSYFKRQYRRGFERGIDDFQDHRADLHRDVDGPVRSAGSSAREIADDAIAFFERNRTGRWFLWLHFYDPHLGYERHPEVPAFGDTLVDQYDGEIRFTDLHLGRLLERLRALDLWDRTAVLVTGDHGEGFGEKGISAHGYHLNPAQTRVPIIARVPGLPARRVATPVSHVDLAPTLLNLARGAHEPAFLGRSLLDLIAGTAGQPPPGPVFQEVTYEGPASPIDGTRRRALVTDRHHLIWNWMPDNTTECYDLAADPGEAHDLWGQPRGGPCLAIKARLVDLVQALALPPDAAAKLAWAISPPGAQAPTPRHPLSATLGSAVRFRGYDQSAPVVTRGPDAEIELAYHFEVLERLPPGWKLFCHLEGPRGMVNADHVPADGLHPVARWRPGQRIRDRHRLPIDAAMAPGRYTVYLGLFRGADRMPVAPPDTSDGANRLRVTTFEVR